MGINKEVWSTMAEAKLFAATKLLGVSNRKFEGEVKSGKTVNVYTYGDVSVSDYNEALGVSFQNLKPSTVSMSIDKTKSFAFMVNDLDLIQNSPDSISEFTQNAVKEVAIQIDGDLLDLCKTKIVTNVVNMSTVKLDKDNIVSMFEEINIALDGADAGKDRFVYVDGRTMSILRQSNLLNSLKVDDGIAGPKNVYKFGDDIEVLESSLVKPIAGVLTIIAGTKDLINAAVQVEDIRSSELENHFATGVKGLFAYGCEIFNEKKGVKLLFKDYAAL